MEDDHPLSLGDLKQCKLLLTLHMSLAKGGFHYLYTCDRFPRLQRRKSADTRRAPCTMQWLVDGIAFANLQECYEALNRSREENEQMAEDRDGKPTPPTTKWTLDVGIVECARELDSRSGRYAQMIGRAMMTEHEANMQNAGLDGTLKFLRFCKEHEAALREFMTQVLKAKQGEAA